ncbi:MAG: sugar-binding protein, partial [Phycisphaerales bacterium]
RSSILSDGSLKEAVNNLSQTTSKLVMVNVGGALRLAESNVNLGPKDAENSPHQLITKLAKSCDKTVVQWCTDEKPNNLGVSASVSGLPPVNDVFGVVMQLTDGLSKGKPEAKAKTWKKEAKAISAVIAKTNRAPVIDGKAEDLWSGAKKYKLTNAIYSPMPSKEDLSANYRIMMDEDNLYMFVDVTDDKLLRDSGSDEWYFDDCIEIFIDADNSKSGGYDDNDAQYHFNWDKSNPVMNSFQHGEVNNVEFAMVRTENGYRTEIKFPWSTLRVKSSKVSKIGLDVHVDDDDDGGERDTKITWSDKEDTAWQTPSVFGTASVGSKSSQGGMVGWWKFDESEGWRASDSSGNNLTGTLKGDPQWQPSGGVIGGALKLDGEDDYVEIEYNTDLPVWTIAVWAKSPEAPTSEMPTCPITREKNYQINWDHAHDAFRGAAGVSVGGEWYAASFGDLEPNIWYHLAATYDGENLKAYKDGVLTDDNSAPSGMPQMEGETLKLGKNAIYDLYFKGAIDDARVYSYALDEGQIKKICSEGKQK